MKAIWLFAMFVLSVFILASQKQAGPDDAVVLEVTESTTKRPDPNQDKDLNFDRYKTDNWKTNFDAFAKSLVKKAKDMKLNHEALKKSLKLVREHAGKNLAYLPVGAYQMTFKDQKAWKIFVKWEGVGFGGDSATLSHVREFTYSQAKQELLHYSTCR